MNNEKFHRHIGVYGICRKGNMLLAVRKARGPYRNRYDLPGGSIEENESVIQAIHREFVEETGIRISVSRNAGFAEYIVKYHISDNTHVHHIALFLEVTIETGSSMTNGISDDTLGIEWINLDKINDENSSPLVLTAKQYITENKIDNLSIRYDDWTIREDEAWK